MVGRLSGIDPLLPLGDGHTLLTEEDKSGLKPSYITTKGELDEAEQRNILRAARFRPPSPNTLLDDAYLRKLHKRMFGDVWEWAGKYRRSLTNIGIAPEQIATATRNLVLDATAWIAGDEHPDVVAVRFHHRLVGIHPFPNGNGRHARLAARYLVVGLGQSELTWGANAGMTTEQLRKEYLEGIFEADDGSLDRLVAFARR